MNHITILKHRFRVGVISLVVMASLACGLLTDAVSSLTAEENITFDGVVFPDAGIEFLFEMVPFGTLEAHNRLHIIRWRVFASDASLDDAGKFYTEQLSGWQVEQDEVVNDHRHFIINSAHRLSSVDSQAEFSRRVNNNANLPAGLLDIEVVNARAHASRGRLVQIDPGLLPDGTIIIVADYLYHALEATPTVMVETPPAETPPAAELDQTCQQTISASLCANPYFPPIEGMMLVYEIDGRRIQTRQINQVQTGVHVPGEPAMDSFTVTFIDENINIDMEFLCTQEGLSGGDVGRMMVSVLEGQEMGGETVSLESMTYEGVTLPNDIKPGDTWDAFVEVVLNAPEGVKLIAANNATYFFEGYETVTVPAGTFVAQKIIADMVVDVGALLPDGHFMSLTSTQIRSVSYYAECVGMVKSESDLNLELIDIIMP